MADHYYTNQPSVKSDRKQWSTVLKGHSLRFITDRGVFSKEEVDFGSRFLIDEISPPSIAGDILDVGCGYGPIGLTLAKEHQERSVVMVDVNERAIELAKENAAANHISNVSIYASESFDSIKERGFALIVTNPPIRAGKTVVHDILIRSYDYLSEHGELWVVIQKKQGAPSAFEKLKEVFSEVSIEKKKKGYYLLVAKKV
ncbi:class I SAM-dependent methyltransferase [Alkalihalobacillus trypoxylicola]|uniref:16S rRNA methyltransferase n=1 Tax=Alkalihalobacillus trypoxylicola TaxID=519424 RepID=A0A162EX48_9BACI|nr:class I SAM-dependent methyltransferase [Alkalihalobacillus trypoxylicola]KYG33946.1 16S rRNA methyltransferase [Alkalihalobacillus trypoxylicola]